MLELKKTREHTSIHRQIFRKQVEKIVPSQVVRATSIIAPSARNKSFIRTIGTPVLCHGLTNGKKLALNENSAAKQLINIYRGGEIVI